MKTQVNPSSLQLAEKLNNYQNYPLVFVIMILTLLIITQNLGFLISQQLYEIEH